MQSKATQFKVLIPEYTRVRSRHRADFKLIFKDATAQNIEVEWKTSRFRHGRNTAEKFYAWKKGFVIVVEDDRSKAATYAQHLDVVEIKAEEFLWWFTKNAFRLLGATIAVQSGRGFKARESKIWVIYIGKSGNAESDYLDKGRPKGVWAFRYFQGEPFRRIISIIRGDIVVFVAKWKAAGRQIYPAKNWSCSHVDIFEVNKGYWCSYTDRTFEKQTWNGAAETKEYMHYFGYDPSPKSEGLFKTSTSVTLQGKDFNSKDKLDEEICWACRMSNTQRGAPFEISIEALCTLLYRLNAGQKTHQVVSVKAT